MILPENPKKLKEAIFEQLFYCTRSMEQRGDTYSRRESIYKKGAAGIIRGRLNKASPVIDKQAALIFAPHIIKFWARIPSEDATEEIFNQSDSVTDAIKVVWDELDMDVLFPMAVLWSLVHGTQILSLHPQIRTDWEVELRADLIHPRDFGVGRETGRGTWRLEHQQAVAVRSYHTLEELDRWIARRPDRSDIMERLAFVQMDQGERGSRITGMAPGSTVLQARPENWPTSSSDGTDIPTRVAAEFIELRLFDDNDGDWRCITISGDVILRDVPGHRMGVPGLLPYVKICPDEDPESFWGMSLMETLSPLQEWYLGRMEGMDEKFRQSLRPPTAAIGLGQSFEEKINAFRRAGGRIAVPNQNARIEQFKPEMSDGDFEMMRQIEAQLREQGQITEAMQGRQPSGVRGQETFSKLTAMASAEILSKSLRVESQAQRFAQLVFQNMRRYSTSKLTDANGEQFMLAEFPGSATILVDGHSSSPILVENHKEEAKELYRADLIVPEVAIRMIAPVMEARILRDLRGQIALAKMVAKQKIKLEQQQKRTGKGSVAPEEEAA